MWPEKPRRIAGRPSDLACSDAGERMSEAGPRRLSQGTSGGLQSLVLSASRGGAAGTYRWKALRIRKTGTLVGGCGKGPRLCIARSREDGTRPVQRDRECGWPHRSVRVAGEKPNAWIDTPQKKQGWPLPKAGAVRTVKGHDWCSGANCCITRDRRCLRAIRCPLRRRRSELSTSVLGEGRGWKRRSAR
jgi:hypothetical protein